MGDPVSCTLQECRPEDTMVIDDVPSNKMGDPGIVPAPVLLPRLTILLCPFLSERDVSNRGINPDIHHQIIPPREFDSPVKSSRDAPVMKVILHPPKGIVSCIKSP